MFSRRVRHIVIYMRSFCAALAASTDTCCVYCVCCIYYTCCVYILCLLRLLCLLRSCSAIQLL
jgi:hypothetical protein